ncbi:LysE/ArgO family amino acid transporter [Pseudomonas sp.]|uniref:LysE/ArgO family amino acid transporter n=1 Tax=Pseudomonas sp. TaxID=306 RepID=UPI002896AE88|nr:LysE/ArgO family amino acid transporter [Pseudomonas sp.]
MWQSYLTGLMTMGGLIIAIGAQNTFILAQGLRRKHHLPVAALCLFFDISLVTIGVFGLATLLAGNAWLMGVFKWAGIIFLLYYSICAYRRALTSQSLHSAAAAPRSLGKTLGIALAVTLLNPHVYLDTVLVLGALGNQQPAPLAFTVGAGCASALWFFTLAIGSAQLAPYLTRPRVWRMIDMAIGTVMLITAIQLILYKP